MTADTITYIDPGIGQDKQNESLTVAKDGFLKAWKGNVTADSTLVNAVKQRVGAQTQILTATQMQNIRGAFWGSLLGMLSWVVIFTPLAFLSPFLRIASIAVSLIEGDWLSAIASTLAVQLPGGGTIGSAIQTGFANAFNGVMNVLGSVGNALNTIGQGIYSVYQSVKGFIDTAISFLPGIGPALEAAAFKAAGASIGAQIVNSAISTGIQLGVTRGLESLGINPTISNLAASFTAGLALTTLQGGSAAKAAADQATSIQDSLQKTVTINTIAELGLKMKLDPAFTNIVGLSLATIQGMQIQNPGGYQFGIAFSQIKPQLFSSLAQYGIDKLGTSLGLDPRISTLIGTPISGVINAGFKTGWDSGNAIIAGINDGILRGATSLGIEYLTQQADLDPLLGSLTSRAITGAIEGALNGGDIFGGIFEGFKSSALNVARLGVSGTDSWSQAQYLQRVINFSDIIKQKGLAKAIEDSATQIFHEDAISSILKSFSTVGAYIQNAIDQNKFKTIQVGNNFFKELEVKPGTSIRATDNYSGLVRIQNGSEVIDATYGGSFGKVDDVFGAIKADYQNTLGDGFNSYEQFQKIENGQQTYAEIKDSTGKTVLIITPSQAGGFNTYNSFGDYVNAVIQNPKVNASYTLKDSNVINERVNLNVFFGGQNLNLNDYFEFDISSGEIKFNLESLNPVSPTGASINPLQNKELQNYISNFWMPSAFAQENETKITDAKTVFNNLYQEITSDPDYVHARDQGNVRAIDFLWDKAKAYAGGNTEIALEYFSYIVNFRDKTFPEADIDRLKRLQNIPSALDGQFKNLTESYDNRDKLQHFAVSAVLSYKYGSTVADTLGITNEVRDGLKQVRTEYIDPSYHNNGGYEQADVNANRKGQSFADLLRSNPNAKPSDVLS